MASYIHGLDPTTPLERCAARAVSETHALTLTDDELRGLAAMLATARALTLAGTHGPHAEGIAALVDQAAARLREAR